MKIQIASDLHLDINYADLNTILKKNGDILLLAGDICNCGDAEGFDIFSNFIEKCNEFSMIYHVAGNHEFYNSYENKMSMTDIKKQFRDLEKKVKNYRFLDDEYAVIDDIVIIGATLWTNIPPEYMTCIKFLMNDYKNIYKNEYKITPYDTVGFFKKSKQFIINTIEKFKNCDKKIILLTHHKINWDVYGDFNRLWTNYAYQNHCNFLLKPPVVLAIHGHTHKKYDKIINGVRVVSNPFGYICNDEQYEYDNDFVINM